MPQTKFGSIWPLVPFADDCFDVIVIMKTSNTLKIRSRFFASCDAFLKHRGKTIISTPLNNSEARFRPSNIHII
jgi:2-polyprenyl-3-methyl-5-hydroxy-6-metoxy-1,4-benzoquinol methylase